MSLGKLLVLVAVLAVVWMAFRWLQRTNAVKESFEDGDYYKGEFAFLLMSSESALAVSSDFTCAP